MSVKLFDSRMFVSTKRINLKGWGLCRSVSRTWILEPDKCGIKTFFPEVNQQYSSMRGTPENLPWRLQ